MSGAARFAARGTLLLLGLARAPSIRAEVQAAGGVDLAFSRPQASLDPPQIPFLLGSGAGGIVGNVTANADGRLVAYSVDFPGRGLRDLRLVDVDGGDGAARQPDAGTRPADAPFEVEVLSCTAGGGEVAIQSRVRQFRGGPRNLIVRHELEDGAGGTTLLRPQVQAIDDEESVELNAVFPVATSTGTCRTTVMHGLAAQPDAVTASMAIQ